MKLILIKRLLEEEEREYENFFKILKIRFRFISLILICTRIESNRIIEKKNLPFALRKNKPLYYIGTYPGE